ncbi:MAG: hypothetical protein JKY90_04035 [Gammaproteobacteria bacterium]|nr:hypothetical protein [Gammaproteobacteria bacterium]
MATVIGRSQSSFNDEPYKSLIDSLALAIAIVRRAIEMPVFYYSSLFGKMNAAGLALNEIATELFVWLCSLYCKRMSPLLDSAIDSKAKPNQQRKNNKLSNAHSF